MLKSFPPLLLGETRLGATSTSSQHVSSAWQLYQQIFNYTVQLEESEEEKTQNLILTELKASLINEGAPQGGVCNPDYLEDKCVWV